MDKFSQDLIFFLPSQSVLTLPRFAFCESAKRIDVYKVIKQFRLTN